MLASRAAPIRLPQRESVSHRSVSRGSCTHRAVAPPAAPTASLRGRSYSIKKDEAQSVPFPRPVVRPDAYDCEGMLCTRNSRNPKTPQVQFRVTVDHGACNCMRKDHRRSIAYLAATISSNRAEQEKIEVDLFYTVPLPNGAYYTRPSDMRGC